MKKKRSKIFNEVKTEYDKINFESPTTQDYDIMYKICSICSKFHFEYPHEYFLDMELKEMHIECDYILEVKASERNNGEVF